VCTSKGVLSSSWLLNFYILASSGTPPWWHCHNAGFVAAQFGHNIWQSHANQSPCSLHAHAKACWAAAGHCFHISASSGTTAHLGGSNGAHHCCHQGGRWCHCLLRCENNDQLLLNTPLRVHASCMGFGWYGSAKILWPNWAATKPALWQCHHGGGCHCLPKYKSSIANCCSTRLCLCTQA